MADSPTSPDLRTLLVMYVEEADRVNAASAEAVSALSAVEKAEAAYEAARAELQGKVDALSASVEDLRTCVELALEAGNPNPDPLQMLGSLVPAPALRVPGPPPSPEEVRTKESRTSPGYSKHACYHVLEAAGYKSVLQVSVEVALPRHVVASALNDLWHVDLVRKRRSGLEIEYSLVDREQLPLTPLELASVGTLRRHPEGKAQVTELVASLRSARDQKEAAVEKRPPKVKPPSGPVVDPIARQEEPEMKPPITSVLEFDERRKRRGLPA